MTAGRWSSWSNQIPQFLLLWWPAMKAGFTAMTLRPRDSSQWKYACSPSPKKVSQRKSTHKPLIIPFLKALAWSTCTGFPLDRQSTRNTNLRLKGSSGRNSVGRGQHSSNRVSGISNRTIHQSTTPSLSQHIWPRWAYIQYLTLPIVPTLFSVTAYSLSSEAVVMRPLRRWKWLWRMSLTRSHKSTFMVPCRRCWNGTSALQPDEIISKGTGALCVYYQ